MSKQILIADDSESLREILAFNVQNAGYQIIIARDGLEALSYFDGRSIDLLLTDYHMPNLNGLELTERVRKMEKYKYIPILILTTEKQLEIVKQAKSSGATGWLVKPFDPEKLIQTLRKVIR